MSVAFSCVNPQVEMNLPRLLIGDLYVQGRRPIDSAQALREVQAVFPPFLQGLWGGRSGNIHVYKKKQRALL